jgi:hypothetical protein
MVVVMGCSASAIIPAKVTYTYPLEEPLATYETIAEIGAVAYLDNGSLELYLPQYAPDPSKPNPFRPQRFVFNKSSQEAVWQERKDPEFLLRTILSKEQLQVEGSGDTIALNEGMLLVTFPKDGRKYGDLAGKHIWLTSTAGPDEIFKVRGVYWKSKASFEDLTK